MAHDPVTVVTVSPRLTAVVSEVTDWVRWPDRWRPLLDEVYAFIRASAELRDAPRWQNVMLYKDRRPSVEVGVLAPKRFTGDGRVTLSQLPGGTAAMAVHRGDYGDLGATHDAIVQFIRVHGLEQAGPLWEVYGHWHDDPARLEVEIYHLLRAPD
jgi:effector-binding domain-containing protein